MKSIQSFFINSFLFITIVFLLFSDSVYSDCSTECPDTCEEGDPFCFLDDIENIGYACSHTQTGGRNPKNGIVTATVQSYEGNLLCYLVERCEGPELSNIEFQFCDEITVDNTKAYFEYENEMIPPNDLDSEGKPKKFKWEFRSEGEENDRPLFESEGVFCFELPERYELQCGSAKFYGKGGQEGDDKDNNISLVGPTCEELCNGEEECVVVDDTPVLVDSNGGENIEATLIKSDGKKWIYEIVLSGGNPALSHAELCFVRCEPENPIISAGCGDSEEFSFIEVSGGDWSVKCEGVDGPEVVQRNNDPKYTCFKLDEVAGESDTFYIGFELNVAVQLEDEDCSLEAKSGTNTGSAYIGCPSCEPC